MGCIYNDSDGKCELYDIIDTGSCCEKGYCGCADDPDPSYSCVEYESDWTCDYCGGDLNVEDCGCAEAHEDD